LDSNRISAPNCLCKDGFYDEGNRICSSCLRKCETCNNNSNCINCVTDPNRLSAPNCVCVNGYYDPVSSSLCIKCRFSCKTCSTGTTCNTCDTSLFRVKTGN
jgi:hypothetical protein